MFLIAGGCTESADRNKRADGFAGSGQLQGRLAVSNHPLYIDAATNSGFTAATGTAIDYHEDIVDEDAWLASVGDHLLRDVVIVSDWAAARLVLDGHLARTPRVVWARGMVGIAYDAKRVGADVHTIAELFRPPLRGRVALPTDMRLTLGMALLADGIDPSDPTDQAGPFVAQIDVTAGHLVNSVRLGQILALDGSLPLDHLLRGDVDAAVVRASDVVGLERDHPDLRFVIPDEGGLLLTDVAVVSIDAGNPSAANAYLDYVAAPEHAAERYRSLPVLWPPGPDDDIMRRDAVQQDGGAVVADPRRNPPADVRARLRPFRLLGEADAQAVQQSFDRVVHAAG